MSAFEEWVYEWIMAMLGRFDTNITDAVNVLTKDLFSGDMYTMAQGIANVVTPIALTIITIVFLIEFLKITIQMDILKWEYMLKVFFKFVFAKVTIDVSFKLMSAIYATGAEWIAQTGDVQGTLGASVSTAIEKLIKDLGFFECLGLMASMAIPFLAIWLAGLIIVAISYARMFEMYMYISVSPLPCAFLPGEGTGRITKKFFLSFAAVVLQGLFIILSIKLYQSLCSSIIIKNVQSSQSITDITFNMLLGAFVLIMAITKSGGWAKSILDVA